MPTEPGDLNGVFADLLAMDDLPERLRALEDRLAGVRALDARLRTLKRSTLLELRELGWSNVDLAELLDVVPQRVSQLLNQPTTEGAHRG